MRCSLLRGATFQTRLVRFESMTSSLSSAWSRVERALFRVPLGGDHHEFIDQQRTVSVRNAVAFVERIEFGRIQMPLLKAGVERAFIDFAALEVHDFEPDRIGL